MRGYSAKAIYRDYQNKDHGIDGIRARMVERQKNGVTKQRERVKTVTPILRKIHNGTF